MNFLDLKVRKIFLWISQICVFEYGVCNKNLNFKLKVIAVRRKREGYHCLMLG